MSDQNQTNKNQIEWDKEEDEIFIGSLSSIEICGYGLLIISMLSLLLTYKFGIPLKVFSWGGVAIAATVIVIGTSKRLSSKIGT